MRLWIAAFLISLFAFQALPVTALGKSCVKVKVIAGESSEDESGDEETPLPEPGKVKKNSVAAEEFYLQPGLQHSFHACVSSSSASPPPELTITAVAGHARLHTPPPDRH